MEGLYLRSGAFTCEFFVVNVCIAGVRGEKMLYFGCRVNAEDVCKEHVPTARHKY